MLTSIPAALVARQRSKWTVSTQDAGTKTNKSKRAHTHMQTLDRPRGEAPEAGSQRSIHRRPSPAEPHAPSRCAVPPARNVLTCLLPDLGLHQRALKGDSAQEVLPSVPRPSALCSPIRAATPTLRTEAGAPQAPKRCWLTPLVTRVGLLRENASSRPLNNTGHFSCTCVGRSEVTFKQPTKKSPLAFNLEISKHFKRLCSRKNTQR